MLKRLIQFLKSRWPLIVVVTAAPLVIAGAFAWLTDDETMTGVPGLPPTIIDARSGPQPARGVEIDRSLDRKEQLAHVKAEVEKRRAAATPDRVALGQALLQLGKLEHAQADLDVAGEAFREVLALHEDGTHWQTREASLQLEMLARLQQSSAEDRETWQQAADLSDEATALHVAGSYRDAVERADEALTLRRRLWGNEHAETAESLLQLAWLSAEHADFYLRAEGLAREAADRVRKTLGATHPADADCLYVLAWLADDRGDFDGADSLYEEALAIYRNSLGEFSREFARALNRQGRMHNTWGKDYGAGKSFRAQQIRDLIVGPEHPDSAESLEDLAEVAYSMRNFPRAEKLLRQALDIREKLQGLNHPDLARPQSLLAASMAGHGDVSQAEVNIHRALTLTEQSRGSRHPYWAQQRLLMGVLQIRSAYDCAGGYRMLQQVQYVLRDLGLERHPLYCQSIFEQADGIRSEVSDGLDEKESALNIVARRRMEEAIAAYRLLPEYDRIACFAEALSSLHDIWYYQEFAGVDRDAEERLIAEAEKVIRDNGGASHPIWGMIPFMRARSAMYRGDYEHALPDYAEHIRRIERQYGTTHPWAYGHALHGLTGGLVHQGDDLQGARDLTKKSFDVYMSFLRRNAAGQSDLSRLSTLHYCFYQMSANLSLGDLFDNLPSIYDEVLAIRGMLGSFQVSDRVAHDHRELLPLQQAVRDARQAMKAIAFSTEPDEPGKTRIERLQKVSDEKEFAESELALATRPFVPPDLELTWQELQAALPERTAFVDFVQFIHHASPEKHRGRLVRQRRMLAFILKKTGAPECVRLGPSQEIEKLVDGWQKELISFQTGEPSDMEGTAKILARTIWAPILPHLPNIDNLYVAPDGPLNFVSFAALPGRKPGSYTVEEFAVSYVNSGRLLYQQLRPDHPPRGRGLLACGDIEYQRTDRTVAAARGHEDESDGLLSLSEKWKNLKAAGLEIDRAAELHPPDDGGAARMVRLAGREAQAARLLAALAGNWRTVHFAGHGFFVNPAKAQFLSGHFFESVGESRYFLQRHQLLLSGLVLAPESGESHAPTILTAEEVGSLDLRETDLVVLSACETGLGCDAGTDGVLGLTRAFLTAGSRSVVSSLWKVDDAATSLLMEEFYQNLWQRRLPKAEALRRAQLTVLKAPGQISERSRELALRGVRGLETGKTRVLESRATDPDRSHPALWAAFVLNGDAR